MNPRRVLFLTAALLLVGSFAAAQAPAPCAPPVTVQPCAPVAPCQPAVQYVEKTILCPTWVTETRMVDTVECRTETRPVTYTICRQIPETQEIKRECTIMVPQVQTRQETVMVCKPVWTEVPQQVTVMVPHTEMQPTTRQVCRMVPVTEMQTVCEDQGHWEDVACPPPAPCAPCAPVQTQKCWKPNIVQKQVPVTCMKPQMTTETVMCPVTVCRPEVRTCVKRECHIEQVPVTRSVCFTVCVPKTVVRTQYVTTCRCVQEPVVRNITVPVSVTVQKPIQVSVCKLVPQTIKVPVCQPCCEPCCPPKCKKHRRGCC